MSTLLPESQENQTAIIGLEASLTAAIASADLAVPRYRHVIDELLTLKSEAVKIRADLEGREAAPIVTGGDA